MRKVPFRLPEPIPTTVRHPDPPISFSVEAQPYRDVPITSLLHHSNTPRFLRTSHLLFYSASFVPLPTSVTLRASAMNCSAWSMRRATASRSKALRSIVATDPIVKGVEKPSMKFWIELSRLGEILAERRMDTRMLSILKTSLPQKSLHCMEHGVICPSSDKLGIPVTKQSSGSLQRQSPPFPAAWRSPLSRGNRLPADVLIEDPRNFSNGTQERRRQIIFERNI